MEFCIKTEELRKALAEIEAAEANGFMYCVSVFRLASVGRMLDNCQAVYNDMCEQAHPTNGHLNWGRFQSVTKRNRFVDGKLIPIESVSLPEREIISGHKKGL